MKKLKISNCKKMHKNLRQTLAKWHIKHYRRPYKTQAQNI